MLNFFRNTAKIFFGVLFVLSMIGVFVTGIIICNAGSSLGIDTIGPGIGFMIEGFLVIFFIFSIAGSFLALVDDVAAIRKKLINLEQEAEPVKKIIPKTTERYWNCPKCRSVNSISNLYCQNCGNPKSDNSAAINADSAPRFWTCPDCGCYNPLSEANCSSCGTPKPRN